MLHYAARGRLFTLMKGREPQLWRRHSRTLNPDLLIHHTGARAKGLQRKIYTLETTNALAQKRGLCLTE